MSFVRAANPIWSFVDLTGLELNDEYFAFFLENIFPYLPQPVFQDQNGLIPWSDPLELLANGTLPDNLYFDSTKVYRIEIRHGNTQADALIYEINNFIPGTGGSGPTDLVLSTDNQITNSQFAFINFTSPLSLTVAGIYNIAPGWALELVGAGTATITKINTISGDQDIINNPPYALEFNLSGWTTAKLYQQFNMNGALWASTSTQDSAVTMSITAKSNDGVARPITLNYHPSTGSDQIITTESTAIGSYDVIDGAIILPQSTNSDISDNAFVQMQIILPPTGDVSISNVQVIGEDQAVPLTYEQETIERQQDHLFHYYANSLIVQPKNDILTGWNFSLNPFQFITTGATTATLISSYVADQTILVQKNATSSSVSTNQAGIGSNFAFSVNPLKASNQFALIQYIDPSTIRPYWGYKLSSVVRSGFNTNVNKTLRFKMRLIYRTSLPSTISNTEPIASWAGTDPVFAAGWTAITPPFDPVYTLVNGVFLDFPFNGMVLPAATNSNMTLGIVVYMIDDMVVADSDVIRFEKISLVPNDFAIETTPMTWDESLRRCQFYYEKSYPNSVVPANISQVDQLQSIQYFLITGGNVIPYPTPFSFQFNTVKRGIPSSLVFFSPQVGTQDAVDVNVYIDGTLSLNTQVAFSTHWDATFGGGQPSVKGLKAANLNPLATVTLGTVGLGGGTRVAANILYQFIADARLGV